MRSPSSNLSSECVTGHVDTETIFLPSFLSDAFDMSRFCDRFACDLGCGVSGLPESYVHKLTLGASWLAAPMRESRSSVSAKRS
jgi:hypothetical protein